MKYKFKKKRIKLLAIRRTRSLSDCAFLGSVSKVGEKLK